MHMYPIFLSLARLHVLVAGAGTVGRRKIASLCESGAGGILVLDPSLSAAQREDLEKMPGVHTASRHVRVEDIAGKTLVFAATNNAEENSRIADLCVSMNVLCNVADDPAKGTFHVPARTNAKGLMAAFSTNGKSPALARRIREDAGVWLETRYGSLIELMGRLRPHVLGLDLPADDNAKLFRSVVYSGLDEALAQGRREDAVLILADLLPARLCGHIEELLDGLC